MVISISSLKKLRLLAFRWSKLVALKRSGHIYKHGARSRIEKQFKRRYGSKGGKKGKGGAYVYGAVVGKLTRQRYGKRKAVQKAAAGHRKS
jgi:hypothetical protein